MVPYGLHGLCPTPGVAPRGGRGVCHVGTVQCVCEGCAWECVHVCVWCVCVHICVLCVQHVCKGCMHACNGCVMCAQRCVQRLCMYVSDVCVCVCMQCVHNFVCNIWAHVCSVCNGCVHVHAMHVCAHACAVCGQYVCTYVCKGCPPTRSVGVRCVHTGMCNVCTYACHVCAVGVHIRVQCTSIVCLHTAVYAHVCTGVCACTCTCVHTSMSECAGVCMHVHVHCMYVQGGFAHLCARMGCVLAHPHTCSCIYVCTCVRAAFVHTPLSHPAPAQLVELDPRVGVGLMQEALRRVGGLGGEGGGETSGHIHGVTMALGHAWRGQHHQDTCSDKLQWDTRGDST